MCIQQRGHALRARGLVAVAWKREEGKASEEREYMSNCTEALRRNGTTGGGIGYTSGKPGFKPHGGPRKLFEEGWKK